MARASCVYVVCARLLGEPIAGFTVKHEMVSWLKRTNNTEGVTIWRLPDGDFSWIEKAGTDITDKIMETVCES